MYGFFFKFLALSEYINFAKDKNSQTKIHGEQLKVYENYGISSCKFLKTLNSKLKVIANHVNF